MESSTVLDTEMSMMGQLKKKAKECEDLKRKYIAVLAETKGEDVFKYLLLLTQK